MLRRNFPTRKTIRRERALQYWNLQLNKQTRSPRCEMPDDRIKKEIASIEKKLGAIPNQGG